MDCSGFFGVIGDQPPWGVHREDNLLQIAFGPGGGGFIVLTGAEGEALLDQIRREGAVTFCGVPLSDKQVREMTLVLQKLLKALW